MDHIIDNLSTSKSICRQIWLSVHLYQEKAKLYVNKEDLYTFHFPPSSITMSKSTLIGVDYMNSQYSFFPQYIFWGTVVQLEGGRTSPFMAES